MVTAQDLLKYNELLPDGYCFKLSYGIDDDVTQISIYGPNLDRYSNGGNRPTSIEFVYSHRFFTGNSDIGTEIQRVANRFTVRKRKFDTYNEFNKLSRPGVK